MLSRMLVIIIYAGIIASMAYIILSLTVQETLKFSMVSVLALIFTELVFFPVINFREIENKIEKKYVI